MNREELPLLHTKLNVPYGTTTTRKTLNQPRSKQRRIIVTSPSSYLLEHQHEGSSWLQWLTHPREKPPTYKLFDNLKSGLTVALVNIPLSLSLSLSSGGTPEQGIITAFWAGLMSAIFSSSHFNIVGPTGALSGMLSVLTIRYGAAVLQPVAFFASVILCAFFLLRIDKAMRYVSTSVAHGFSVGVAVIIAISQFPNAFGLTRLIPRDNLIQKFEEIAIHLPNASTPNTIFFFVNIIPLFYCVIHHGKVPWALIYAVFGIIFGFCAPTSGVVLLNNKYPRLQLNLFHFSIPDVAAYQTLLTHFDIIMYSFGVAVVALLETLISAQIANTMLKDRSALNYRSWRESGGVTLSNFVTSLFGGIPATAALARTSLNVKAGAFSRVSSLIGCAALALFSTIFFPWFEFIPMPTVAALLLIVSYRLVDFHELSEMRKVDSTGIHVFFITAVACVVADTFIGLLLGIAVSCYFNREHFNISRVDVTFEGSNESGWEEVHVYIKSSLKFINARDVRDNIFAQLKNLEEKDGSDHELLSGEEEAVSKNVSLLFDLDHCDEIDFDGLTILGEMITLLRGNGCKISFRATRHVDNQLKHCQPFLELGKTTEEEMASFSEN